MGTRETIEAAEKELIEELLDKDTYSDMQLERLEKKLEILKKLK